MDHKTRWIAGGTLALVVIGGGTGIAVAGSGDGDEPLTGSDLDEATAAALAHTGGGTVTETEVGDDGAAYGVEIRLDENFGVIGQVADDDGPNDQDGSSGD